MKLIRRILGFDSPYSFTKWLRICALIVAVIFAAIFMSQFAALGIFGFIIFIVVFAPAFLVCMGIALAVGVVLGGVTSGKKQAKSLRESEATGSAELVDLDKLRIKVQAINLVFTLLVAAFIIGSVVLYASGTGGTAAAAYFFAGVVIIVAVAIARMPMVRRYKSAFKDTVVRGALESVLDNLVYEPGRALDRSVVESARMFGGYNMYSGNDFIEADYRGRHFIQSDLHLQEQHEEEYQDDDGEWQTRTVYTTIFNGRFAVFDYDAISNEPVYVFDKRARKTAGSSAQTELDAFNKRFTVSAENAVDALRILTPQVLEGIVLASDKLGVPMSLGFLNDRIYIAVHNGDAFEAATRGDTTLSEQRGRVSREIQSVLDLAETIYLK